MLSLHHVAFNPSADASAPPLLQDISFWVPAGHLMAVVGPSGCGKSTLLKVIAGISPETAGEVCWRGQALSENGQIHPAELGYVPQFSIAYPQLTVEESIAAATCLRLPANARERAERVDEILQISGLEPIAERAVKFLSGGQKRRLGLAMELVSHPSLLLCDEVTSGLDPRSEQEIVQLLHRLTREHSRLVLSVTHSLSHLHLYDSVLVLYGGRALYHGPASSLTHYFGVKHPEDIYPALAQREAADWAQSWQKHYPPYYRKLLTPAQIDQFQGLNARFSDNPELAADLDLANENDPNSKDEDPANTPQPSPALASATASPTPAAKPSAATDPWAYSAPSAALPGFWTQFWLTFSRRWTIFRRDRVTLLLHLAILLGFPALVAAFGAEQQEAIRGLGDTVSADLRSEAQSQMRFSADMARVGGRVSGLIMFQVVLLTLIAANNAAREIAGERDILEKEKLGGLSPAAYLAGRLSFLAILVVIQSLWMAGFVQFFWPFPGSQVQNHVLMLLLVNGAVTALCLGISSLLNNPDQANLLSIYLVGFQLPLSGAILTLPDWLTPLTKPLISAFWAWSGSVSSLEGTEFSAVREVAPTLPAALPLAVLVLSLQLLAGLIISWIGIAQRRWRF